MLFHVMLFYTFDFQKKNAVSQHSAKITDLNINNLKKLAIKTKV